MTQDERRLLRHLVIAVLINLLVLAGLWWAFVRDVCAFRGHVHGVHSRVGFCPALLAVAGAFFWLGMRGSLAGSGRVDVVALR